MSRSSNNLGVASPPVLIAAGAAVGAVAASSLLFAFKWINSRPQTQTQQTDRVDSQTLSTSTHPSAVSSLSTSSTVPPLPPPRSRSHSAARFEGSVSRIASDTSYLEENEYEPNDNHLLHDDDESHPSRLFPHAHPEAHDQNSSEPISDHDVYLCPHCSNYINSLDLIPVHPEDSDYDPNSADPGVSEAETQRILSAAEQLNIQLALKDSLHKIFQSVDEDSDGVITRDQMGVFLTKLGLTGEREQAFLNIVGGDSVQYVPTSSASEETDSAPSIRRSFSTGPMVGEPHSARAGEKEKRGSGSGAKSMVQVVGINFKQFFDRFQDTLGSIDDFMHEAANGVDGATSSSDHQSVPMVELNSNSSSPPALSPTHASNLLTPPRGNRLTVNTLTPNNHLNVATSDGQSASHRTNSSALFSSPFTQAAGGSLASSPAHAASNPAIRVFLGGACGETTWRKDIAIPQFQTAGVSFYNPQVKDWNQKLVALEGLMKAWCKILFFVVGSKTRALASMIEVASLIAAGRRVVLVIEPIEPGVEIEGQVPSGSEVKDLNRAREYLRDVASNYSIPVHTSTDAGVKAIIAMEEEERREARARMASRNSIIGGVGLPSGGSARRGRASVIVTGNSTLTSPLSPGHRKNAHSGGQPFHSSSAATASSLAAASQLPMHHSHSHHHHHHSQHAHSHSHSHSSHSHGHHVSHAAQATSPTATIASALEKEGAALAAASTNSESAAVATATADVDSSTAAKHHSAAKKKDRKKH